MWRYRNDTLLTEEEIEANKKKMNRVYIALFLSFIFIMLCAFIPQIVSHIRNSKGPIVITALNEEYQGKLDIKATNIKAIELSDKPGTVIVGVRFEIANNSNKERNFSYDLDAYVDDIKADAGYERLFNNNNEYLVHGEIAPGKKMVGYATAIATKDSQKVEFIFENIGGYGTGQQVIFEFDIPKTE